MIITSRTSYGSKNVLDQYGAVIRSGTRQANAGDAGDDDGEIMEGIDTCAEVGFWITFVVTLELT
jgi:hypothetical protein